MILQLDQKIKLVDFFLTNGSPGSDKVSLFAWFALSCLVICRHPEGVLQTFNQAHASVLGGFYHSFISLHPQKAVPLLLLNTVPSDGTATIAAGMLPGQDDKVLVDLIDLQVSGLAGRIFKVRKQKTKTLTHIVLAVKIITSNESCHKKLTKWIFGDHFLRVDGL